MLVFTNLVIVCGVATVKKPYLQLQGFGNEPLSSLAYDITNETNWRTGGGARVLASLVDSLLPSKEEQTVHEAREDSRPTAASRNRQQFRAQSSDELGGHVFIQRPGVHAFGGDVPIAEDGAGALRVGTLGWIAPKASAKAA